MLAGIIAAIVISPSGVSGTKFEATNTLLLQQAEGRLAGGTAMGLGQLRSLSTGNEVASRVAKTLSYDGDVAKLGKRITPVIDQEAGTLALTATAPKAAEAAVLADTFASELLIYLDNTAKEAQGKELEQVNEQITQLRARLNDLENRIGTSTGVRTASARALQAESNAVGRQLAVQIERAEDINNQQLPSERLESVQKAEPKKVANSLSIIGGTGGRVALAAVLSLVLGMILALVVDRMDTRIRTKEHAEAVFDAPVLAEIPVFSSDAGLAAMQPHSHVAEAFRALRASLLLMRGSRAEPATEEIPDDFQTLLVTSGNPSEGKTTTACNLAASFGETGRRVLLVDCDFRHPRVEFLFHLEPSPGLSDALVGGRRLRDVVIPTAVPNVSVVTAGLMTDNPAELFAHIGPDFLTQAKELADLVIIDTPPVLVITDATGLVPYVDGIVLVCKAGQTTASSGARAAELLGRLAAPLKGVVLMGAKEAPTSKGYYYDYYRDDKRRSGRGRRRDKQPPVPTRAGGNGKSRKPQAVRSSARGRGR